MRTGPPAGAPGDAPYGTRDGTRTAQRRRRVATVAASPRRAGAARQPTPDVVALRDRDGSHPPCSGLGRRGPRRTSHPGPDQAPVTGSLTPTDLREHAPDPARWGRRARGMMLP